MDMSLSLSLCKLQEIGKDREAWRAAVHGVTQRVTHDLVTQQHSIIAYLIRRMEHR